MKRGMEPFLVLNRTISSKSQVYDILVTSYPPSKPNGFYNIYELYKTNNHTK